MKNKKIINKSIAAIMAFTFMFTGISLPSNESDTSNISTVSALSIEPKLGGYYIVLSHNEAQLLAKGQLNAKTILGKNIWTRISASIGRTIKSKDKGKGVKIKMLGYGTTAFIIGVESR